MQLMPALYYTMLFNTVHVLHAHSLAPLVEIHVAVGPAACGLVVPSKELISSNAVFQREIRLFSNLTTLTSEKFPVKTMSRLKEMIISEPFKADVSISHHVITAK